MTEQIDLAELTQPFVVPASFAQQRMWFLDRIESGGAAYNVPTVTRLRGPLDIAALERALDAVVARHESLRTTFTLLDGVPHQVIHDPSPFTLDVTDLSGDPRTQARGLELARAHGRDGFDLASDRLFRAALIRLGPEDHILALTLHHIITDAWSVGVVNREIAKLYGAFVEGHGGDLPELAIQYADYAAWQQQWMDSGGLDDQLSYWVRTLEGAPALLELPSDRPRPLEQSFRGATLRTVLPRQLADRVRALGEREGATMFMTLLAAFATMLSRYSRQDDLVVATPVANRNRVEFEQLTGLLVNTLAIRVELADDPSFVELLRRVRERCLDAFSNQDVPFERLVGELNPERNRSHAPVAQVMFAMQNAAEKPTAFPGLEHERVTSDRGTAKFDLALFVGELREGLRVAIEYCTDLFEASTIERMLGQLEALLAAIVADPERPVSQLDFLPEAERQQITEWGVARPAAPIEHCIHQLVADQARRTPDAVAVALGEDDLTYAELDVRANRLAWRLHALGVGPDSVVGICVERGIDVLVAVLATLKAGAAYAPIDPTYPRERVAFMLADSAVPVLLTQRQHVQRLPEHQARVVCVDDDDEPAGPVEEAEPPASGVTPDHLAYVLYTSGSTGQPKGVAMAHRPLVNLLAWQLENWTAPAPARTLQFASLSFDVAFQEIFSTWCAGGTVVLIDEEDRRDPEVLLALLAREQVERLFLPFVALQALCEAAEDIDLSVPSLRDVITAGEQLKVTPPIRRFFARHVGCRLFNHYGPTESHVVTSFALDGSPEQWPELPPIGRPIHGAVIRLLDAHRRAVPIGVPGELCIGGVSLARGYLGRPELTAERFVADPFSAAPGARLYRTGDLARHLSDGNVEFLGRIDHQTKVRGYRIEPGEVEAALREHVAVRDAIVTAVDDGRGGSRLVAYLLVDDPVPGSAELHDVAARLLPEYMVPSAFVALDAFPLTPTGKVDRRALPAPAERHRSTSDFVAPGTELERSLAEIWSELLGVERVGANDNFFALGGHSLLAVRVIARIRERLGVELALSVLFRRPTVTGLAQALLEGEPAGARAVAVRPIGRAPREPCHVEGVDGEVVVLPASYAEARLWFLDRLEPNNPAYNVTLAARLTGPLDSGALSFALDEVVRRHESLRTTFSVADGAPVQVVASPQSVPIPLHDLTGRPDADGLAQELAEELAGAGFDLSVGPLLRASLIRVRRDEHILVISLHHIVVDGWSIGVLNRELSALYRAHRTGRQAGLPEPAIQYGDFAVWQQEWMRGGGLDEQLDYWTRQLANAPALLELPTDRPRPSRQTFRGGVVRRELADATLEGVRRLGEREGTTLFMTLLAAFMVLLARYSGQDDVVVASPVANRNRTELEGLIGFFVNTLALRAHLDDDPSFRELLASVRETAVGAFSNQDLPFEKLVEVLAPDRQMSFPPVAQVTFALNAVEGPFEFDGLQSARVSGARRTTKFDLGLYAAERPDGLRLSIEYAADLFDEVTAARMLGHYENLLCSVVGDPSRPVSTLRLLDDDERRAAVASSAPTATDYPVACMHELFERQAAEQPAAIAATFMGQSISYGDLDQRANRLANRLRSLGARPGTLVAVLLEPSLETLVAILGVLKAGAAYVPLDAEHPDERLAFVLRDAGAPIAISAGSLLGRLPRDGGLAVVQLDQGDESLLGEPTVVPEPLATPDDVAYVIYTSGSTGAPKGVQIEHRHVARLFSATEEWFRPGPQDTWTLLHSYAFDFSVWELWGALAHGGRLVVPPRATTRAPDALAELIGDEGVTVLNATPSLFLAIQEELIRRADRLVLRLVIFGGEALHPPALRSWFERFGDRDPRLVNMYGITETTVHVTYRPLTTADCHVAASPIGEPIPDLGLYLLDGHLEPVPPGVVGELYVAGAGVAAGYLNRPELTGERFIANPFGPGRLYRSGDLARRLGHGELEFRGRADDQVKVRGFRIELGEVRAAVVSHPAVAEAAVVVSRTDDGEPRLVAYVATGDTISPPRADELRAFVADRLPAYMVPAAWSFLDALPLTRNGKLDVHALPAPEYDRSAAADAFVAPSTETEQALARIWREILGVPEVGVNDSFFELGGHSMLAVRLFAEIESVLGARLPLSALFEGSTIAGLARFIERDRSEDLDFPSVVRLRDGVSSTPLFLVAWAGGEVLPYRDVVETLAAATPVFGLLAPGAGGRGTPLDSVEQLAAFYVEELRKVQPRGPYLLGGYCFSGLVAYEMARSLIGQGETIATLALIDSYPFRPRRRPTRLEIERVKFRAFKSADARGRLAWIWKRIVGLRKRAVGVVYVTWGPRIYDWLARHHRAHLIPRRPWNLVLVASNLARSKYVPRPLDVQVEFFRAQTEPDARATPWEDVATRGVVLHQVVAPSIDHASMMQAPHAQLLAKQLSRTLADADAALRSAEIRERL